MQIKTGNVATVTMSGIHNNSGRSQINILKTVIALQIRAITLFILPLNNFNAHVPAVLKHHVPRDRDVQALSLDVYVPCMHHLLFVR